MKIKIGIFFGGPSNEREYSFISGRTVYENLDRSIFIPVPIFVDHACNWTLFNSQDFYKSNFNKYWSTTSDFPQNTTSTQALSPDELHQHIDFAFIAIHGEYGEDGRLQKTLEDLAIPYSGTGAKSSQLGMDELARKKIMQEKGFACQRVKSFSQSEWFASDIYALYSQLSADIGSPMMIKSAHKRSHSTSSIITKNDGLEGFELAVNQALQRELIPLEEWQDRNAFERQEYIKILSNLEDGLGYPIEVSLGSKKETIYSSEQLLSFLNQETAEADYLGQLFVLEKTAADKIVIFEPYTKGKSFALLVIKAEDGSVIALPPYELANASSFDSATTLFQGENDLLESLRRTAESFFTQLNFQSYLGIVGQYTDDGQVYLNQLNVVPRMHSTAFIFQQAAAIGLNTSQFLTFMIRISLQERLLGQGTQASGQDLLQNLDRQIAQLQSSQLSKQRIGVILGGYSYERHLSVESGRYVVEQLSSSEQFKPIPIFLTGNNQEHELYQLPISFLLAGNADTIKNQIKNDQKSAFLDKIRLECGHITKKYGGQHLLFNPQRLSYDELAEKVQGAFIALHGRPGEDGQVQKQLEIRQLAYNGSGIRSANITIDKFRTLQLLKKHGYLVTEQVLLSQQEFNIDASSFYQRVEKKLAYPFIAKPVDDGCSSAVKTIYNRNDLEAYSCLIFDTNKSKEQQFRHSLKLKSTETFPIKTEVLFEEMIIQENGIHFVEVTGGLYTDYSSTGQLQLHSFELSEIIDGDKDHFITPARLAIGAFTQEYVQAKVQQTFERAARLLKVEGYCCIDAFVRILADGKVETQIIELNSLPDMTPNAIIFQQAIITGQKPSDFIQKMLTFGFERLQKKIGKPTFPIQEKPSVNIEQKPNKTPTPPTLTTIQTLHTDNMDEPKIEPQAPSPQEQAPLATALKIRFSKIKQFITSSYFLKNLGAMLGVIVLGFLLINLFLNAYTSHGRSVQVENYTGMSLENATQKAEARGFAIQVNEAPFSNDINTGEVISQEPVALSRIKKNRTIYLTVIGGPKETSIPSFQEAADEYTQYVPMLQNLQLNCTVKEEVFDAKLGNGTILYFLYRGKKYMPNDVKRGVKVLQGSTLEFVITKNFDDNVRLPSLVCKRFVEVEFLLNGSGINVGDIHGNVPNRADAFVYQQEPAYSPGKRVVQGSSINVYLQQSRPTGCPAEVEIKAPESDSGGLPSSTASDTVTQKPSPSVIDTTGSNERE